MKISADEINEVAKECKLDVVITETLGNVAEFYCANPPNGPEAWRARANYFSQQVREYELTDRQIETLNVALRLLVERSKKHRRERRNPAA